MFKRKIIAGLFALTIICFSLAGCGEKTVTTASDSNKAEASASCLGCHESAVSSVTGKTISSEWLLSNHNLKNGAGCADCHEPDQNHPSSCNRCHGSTPTGSSSTSSTHNPDSAGKCAKCHTETAGFGFSTYNGDTRNILKSHFNNTSSSYVSSQNVNNCRKCHNPHDTTSKIDTLRAWARSGHGQTGAWPWNEDDFKTKDPCNRCHTTTGYIQYLDKGITTPWGVASDLTKEMIGCAACHNDYSYSVRETGAVTAPYTNISETYPNAGKSNLCINCHSGRASGNSIKNSTADFTNSTIISSHYMAAGGVVFGQNGYHFGSLNYDSHIKGDATNNDFIHDRLGREDVYTYGQSIGASASTLLQFQNAANFIKSNNLETSGPCVVCHLTSKLKGVSSSHRLKPFTIYSDSDTSLNAVCLNCHTTRGEGSNSKETWFRAEWERNITAGLDVLNGLLKAKNIYYDDTQRNFYKDTNSDGILSANEAEKNNRVKNWTLAWGAPTAKDTMGAAFNYLMLKNDAGAIAHNRMYVRRLLYDSIDYMDNGLLDYSVGITIKAMPSSDTRDFAAILLINKVNNNGLSGKERRPNYTAWMPSNAAGERY